MFMRESSLIIEIGSKYLVDSRHAKKNNKNGSRLQTFRFFAAIGEALLFPRRIALLIPRDHIFELLQESCPGRIDRPVVGAVYQIGE